MADYGYNSQSYMAPNDVTDGSKPKKSVSTCLRRVNDAMLWRKNAGYDEKWSDIIKLYANQYEYTELSGYEDIVAPNMMFSTMNVIVPSVMVNYPKVTVTARKPEYDRTAPLVEGVANFWWQHYNFQGEMRLAVKDFVGLGLGIIKVGWTLEEQEEEKDRDEWVEEVQEELFRVASNRAQAEMMGMEFESLSEDEIIASIPTIKNVVTEDHPSTERVSPFDLYFDPDATRIKNARWIAQRMYIPLEDARNFAAWNPKARKRLKGTAMSQAKKDYDLMFKGEERGREADFVIVWEYYDMIDGTVCVFADGCDMFLIEPEKFVFPFGHPYIFFENHIVPEKLYPMGDLESIVPLQKELALTRTQMVNDRKRFRRMYLYKPDEIGPDGLAALTSSDDNALIPVDTDGPFADVLAPIATSSLPPEFYNQTAMILDDMDRTSAVTEYQRGSVAEVRRTATEAAMIQDMSNARSADKLAIIERGISEVARKCVQLAQEFLSSEQVAKIVGIDAQVDWVPFDRDAIAGEYDFIVEAGSTVPMNESFRRQSAMQLLDAMAPFIGAGVVNAAKLAEHVLRQGFGIKDTSQFIQEPPPMAAGPEQGGMPPGAMPAEMGGGMPPQMPAEMPVGMMGM